MELYKTYIKLWRQGLISHGFSSRLPDYATRFWFENLECALPLSGQRVFLDLGAGDGRLSCLMLRSYSTQGLAVEVQVDKCLWKPIITNYGRFELHEGLIQEELAQLSGKRIFDFILLIEVFEHIPPSDIPCLMRGLSNVLAHDGCIFLTTPNYIVQGPAEQSHMWHEKQPYGHYKHYSYDELATLCTQYSFYVKWHNYEGHSIKKKLYNKYFYPMARLDARFLTSTKIPKIIKIAYRYTSWPLILLIRGYFLGIAQLVYAIERLCSNEKTAETMMIVIRKTNVTK